MKARRYDAIMAEIERSRPRRILEIGTCKGERAEQMIRTALKYRPDTEYFGFDLFSHPPDYELTSRAIPDSLPIVLGRLESTGAAVKLFKGDTRQRLVGIEAELPVMDLIFIDGGHSSETIASDWKNVSPLMGPDTIVFFDDYWNYPQGGCNQVIAELSADSAFQVEILEPADVFQKPYGTLKTQLVRVTRCLKH